MKILANVIVLVFVVSSVLSVGLGLSVAQIVAPLRRVRLVTMSLLANFVFIPLVALLISRVLRLSEPQSVGLILLGAAAGAPFLPKLIEQTRGDMAFSVTLMLLLMVGSLAYLPLVLPQLLPGVTVDSIGIARSLLVTMIIPLVLGLFVKGRWEFVATRSRVILNGVSQITLVLTLVLMSALNWSSLMEMSATAALPAVFLLLGFSFGIGFVMGGPLAQGREVLGFGTSARNLPAALLIAGQNFPDPRVAVTVVVFALMSVAVFVPLVPVFARRNSVARQTPVSSSDFAT